MDDEIVGLEGVWAYFNGIPVLEDIGLSVKRNDFLAIIGPNGGGKTTLLQIILGLIKPGKGTIRIFGDAPEKARGRIGYLPQRHTFVDANFPVNVFDVVLMGRYKKIFKNYSQEDRDAVLRALETTGMLDLNERRIGTLSGGQLQRVFVARAIAREPKLLILDEPTTGIDPEMQKSFYELLLKLKKEMTIILVTHDIGVISTYVEQIACLNRRLSYHGPVEGGLDTLEGVYKCPVDLIAHGIPHRVLGEHDKK